MQITEEQFKIIKREYNTPPDVTMDTINHYLEKDLQPKGCMQLIALVLCACFHPKTKNDREVNRDFLKSQLIDMYCDCSENFEASKLRKRILEVNKENI